MKGYKGFDKGMVCRGKQYAENTVYEEERAQICKCGMHFCQNPLDVLEYYPLLDDDCNMREYAEVEALDECMTDDNKKFCTKKLKIGAKISFAKLVQAGVSLDIKNAETSVKTISKKNAHIGSSGDGAHIGSYGNFARIGSSGNFAHIGSSGNFAHIGSSGDGAHIGSSGNGARIGSSGNFAHIGSSGYGAHIGSSGYGARINSTGADSVICCAANGCAVRAKKGSWITLSEWEDGKPVCVKTVQVDGETIKEDVWYKLKNGAFVEAYNDED